MILGNNKNMQKVGNIDIFSDGTIQTHVGNSIINDTNISTRMENTLSTKNGLVQKIGNTYIAPDGLWQHVGNQLLGPNGQHYINVKDENEVFSLINKENS